VPRRATTLVELIVVLAILGILAAVAGVSMRRAASLHRVEAPETIGVMIAGARREAIRSGRAVAVALDDSGTVAMATALPDGSVIADSLHSISGTINRLTGHLEPTAGR
jgi:prepilin-type N-terminal cleavage/methylation domain-containing protein